MVAEVRPDYPSEYAAITAVAGMLGIGSPETIRTWLRRTQIDTGQRPGVTTDAHEEIKRLKREVAELRRANEILKAGGCRTDRSGARSRVRPRRCTGELVMAFNFLAADREQLMLMPPSVAEWLPEDHLAWFVVDIVDELDLSAFLAGYRADGRGGSAYHPRLMLALLVYAYSIGERSSRRIERRLVEDVAFRVVAANHRPDHATIARFRQTHQEAIAGLFGQVLQVCHRANLLSSEVVALDGTKLAGNASRDRNRTAAQLAEQILKEAAAVDAAEDSAEKAAELEAGDAKAPLPTRGGARQARLRKLLAELEEEAAEKSYEAHMVRRAQIEEETGKPIRGRRPSPGSATHRSRRQANLTDPDSRMLKTKSGYVQGYNAQAVANASQVVVAAQVVNDANDASSFVPMLTAAGRNLSVAGQDAAIGQALADAGYWTVGSVNLPGIDVLIAPGRARKLREIGETEREREAVLTQVEHGELWTSSTPPHGWA